LGEADNDHQFITAKQIADEGKVLLANDTSELPERIRQAKGFIPLQGQGSKRILQIIQNYLEELTSK
jgi:hypothetical protein